MCCTGLPTSLQVGAMENCDVRVTSSNGHRLPVRLDRDTVKGVTTAMYTPVEVGKLIIHFLIIYRICFKYEILIQKSFLLNV
jgi:hypothetical protein